MGSMLVILMMDECGDDHDEYLGDGIGSLEFIPLCFSPLYHKGYYVTVTVPA